MKRRIGIAAAVLVFALILTLVLMLSRSASNGYEEVKIQFEDVSSGSVMATNVGTRTVAATMWFQVLSNGVWHPPREELFRLPSGVLVGQNKPVPKGAPSGSGTSLRYRFIEVANGEFPWRVIVLCQRYYPQTLIGQLRYGVARYVTDRRKFSDTDSRGPADLWIYSEIVPAKDAADRPSGL